MGKNVSGKKNVLPRYLLDWSFLHLLLGIFSPFCYSDYSELYPKKKKNKDLSI